MDRYKAGTLVTVHIRVAQRGRGGALAYQVILKNRY